MTDEHLIVDSTGKREAGQTSLLLKSGRFTISGNAGTIS